MPVSRVRLLRRWINSDCVQMVNTMFKQIIIIILFFTRIYSPLFSKTILPTIKKGNAFNTPIKSSS